MSKMEEARRKREQKLREVRRRQSAAIFVVALVLLAVGAGGYLLYNAPFWEIGAVEIAGHQHFTAEQIVSLAAIPKGTSLLKLNKGEVAARLTKSPWIAEARLYRRLPGRLLIDIVERRPFVALKHDGRNYVLDTHSFVIDRAQPGQRLPVLVDLKLSEPVGVGRSLGSKSLREAVASTKSLDPDIRRHLTWISAPAADKLAFYTEDDLQIVYGRSVDAAKKNYILKKILSTAKGKIIYINVTTPTSPIVRKLRT